MRDTTTLEERECVLVMQQNFSDYMGARLSFAVSYIRDNPGLRPGFEVTPAMLDAFYQTITSAGVEVQRELYDSAARWGGNELGTEITISKWGQQAARQ